jgi:hypothetical protein
MAENLAVGPVLRRAPLSRLPLAAGRWLVAAHLRGMPFEDFPLLVDFGIVTGVYVVTDSQDRVRWLGQASRSDDLVGRLAAHAAVPARRATFVTLRFLHLDDYTPRPVLNVIEGRCADLLGLRGAMGSRQWPSADGWLRLVA